MESGQRIPPWEFAKHIMLLSRESTGDEWKINSDPNTPDLAATMNPYVGLKLKEPVHPEGQERPWPTNTSRQRGHDTRPAQQEETAGREIYNSSRRNVQPAEEFTKVTDLPTRGASLGTPPPPFIQEVVSAWRQQVRCAMFALLTTLGSLLVFSERLGLRHPYLFHQLGPLSVVMSGLPGACLAYMCYVRMPRSPATNSQAAVTHSEAALNDPALAFLSTRLTARGLEIVRRSQELHSDFSLTVLKALSCFVLWDILRTYASLWPLLHTTPAAYSESLDELPLFGPAPDGAKIGIAGYPPRRGAGQARPPSLAPVIQLLLPLLADGARLLGLWFSFKAFRQTREGERNSSEAQPRPGWFNGTSQTLLLLLVALPVASVALQQAFWGPRCLQPFTGLMPLVGPQATAFAGLLLRCHSILLATAAALTGAVLAAAFERLSDRHSRSASRVLGLLASLALFCCILFDVLAAAAPSSGSSCTYSPYTSEMYSGSPAVKAFATMAALAHSLALLCLSCSASAFGFKDKALGAALDHEPIDEGNILGASAY